MALVLSEVSYRLAEARLSMKPKGTIEHNIIFLCSIQLELDFTCRIKTFIMHQVIFMYFDPSSESLVYSKELKKTKSRREVIMFK